MPQLSGLDLIHAIKDLDINVPIAVLSNSKESAIRIHCLKSGADEFLTKPFHPIELDARIGNLLRKYKIGELYQNQPPVRSIFRQCMRAVVL